MLPPATPNCDKLAARSDELDAIRLSMDCKTVVVCSCGRFAGLTMPEENPDRKCHATDPGWRYHADPDDENRTRLWNCGREGHYQAVLMPPIRPMLLLLSLLRINLEAAEDACRKAIDAFGHDEVDRDRITDDDGVRFEAILHLVAVVEAKDWAVFNPDWP